MSKPPPRQEWVTGQVALPGMPDVPPPQPNPTWLTITAEFEAELPAEVCWNPGEEPERWTARDLADSIKRLYTTGVSFLDDWNLLGPARITIRDNVETVAHLELP